jgi:hypothetical protein
MALLKTLTDKLRKKQTVPEDKSEHTKAKPKTAAKRKNP